MRGMFLMTQDTGDELIIFITKGQSYLLSPICVGTLLVTFPGLNIPYIIPDVNHFKMEMTPFSLERSVIVQLCLDEKSRLLPLLYFNLTVRVYQSLSQNIICHARGWRLIATVPYVNQHPSQKLHRSPSLPFIYLNYTGINFLNPNQHIQQSDKSSLLT